MEEILCSITNPKQFIRNTVVYLVGIILLISGVYFNWEKPIFILLNFLVLLVAVPVCIRHERFDIYKTKLIHYNSHLMGYAKKNTEVEFNVIQDIRVALISYPKTTLMEDLKKLWKNKRDKVGRFVDKIVGDGDYFIKVVKNKHETINISSGMSKETLDLVVSKINSDSDYKKLKNPIY